MIRQGPAITRRQFLHRLGAVGGAGAVYAFLTATGLLPIPKAHAAITELPPDSIKGKKIIVIGAGVAGVCAAYRAAMAGAEVVVLEGENRYGGRSLTLRNGDSFSEVGGPTQTAKYVGKEEEVDQLYLNAGPGRIPSHHIYVLHYCKLLGVEMETYIFLTRSNLLQNDDVFGGKPIQMRRINQDLRGYVAEMLAKVADQGSLDKAVTASDQDAFLSMLSDFGALSKSDAGLVYAGSDRHGYKILPGAGLNAGEIQPNVPFDDILKSRFWDTEIFNELRLYWQASLMEPKGGMDNIWKGFLKAKVDGGSTVKDLIKRNAAVNRIDIDGSGKVTVGYRHMTTGVNAVERGDFCISTMAPPLLARIDGNLLNGESRAKLRAMNYIAACKVGWQGKNRFWETRDRIYGGISWTKHIISQIWYPSYGFLGTTGMLTGAYIRGGPAVEFGKLSHDERLKVALEGGEKLHPGFSGLVYAENGISIAWQNMAFQSGGWAAVTSTTQPALYRWINQAQPFGNRVYLAGDYLSYMPGWMEGSIRAAHLAVDRIAKAAAEGRPSVTVR